MLIVSLFLPDIWIISNPSNVYDDVLYGFLTGIFIIFIFELIILSLVTEGYFLSFFFFMDLLGTLSMILDIGWMSEGIFPDGTGSSSNTSILRAARAAKLGARYGRIMRLLKLMKLFDFLFGKKNKGRKDSKEVNDLEPTLSAVQSVSKQLSNLLAHRVAALVLLVIMVVPFLAYVQSDESVNAFLISFNSLSITSANETSFEMLHSQFDRFYDGRDVNPISLSVEGSPSYSWSWDYNRVIRNENSYNFKRSGARASMDMTSIAKAESIFSILIILLVIILLMFFSASFHGAVDALVVAPLSRMMSMLRSSATSLLGAAKAMDTDGQIEDMDIGEELETDMLELLVQKLTRVLNHMMPGSVETYTTGEDLDQDTVAWLSTSYSTRTKRRGSGEDGKRRMSVAVQLKKKGMMEKNGFIQTLSSMSGDKDSIIDLSVFNSWRFDVLGLEREELIHSMVLIFDSLDFFASLQIPKDKFIKFVTALSEQYLSNPYHNFYHACDVTHTTYRFLWVIGATNFLDDFECAAILVAALGHDVGHPGVNNNYLVRTKDTLALIHNDNSPLENMHCAKVYEILGEDGNDIFCNMSNSDWVDMRKIILTSILETDMIHHFESVSKLKVFEDLMGDEMRDLITNQKHSSACMEDSDNRLMILGAILHTADISNPLKPFEICEKWAYAIMDEFFSQGDREREAGMEISPFFDRDKTDPLMMQINFIEFVVSPLISSNKYIISTPSIF